MAALKSYAAPGGVGQGEGRPAVGLGQVEARVAVLRPLDRRPAPSRGRARSSPRRRRPRSRPAPGRPRRAVRGSAGRRRAADGGTHEDTVRRVARQPEDHAADRRRAARGSPGRAPAPGRARTSSPSSWRVLARSPSVAVPPACLGRGERQHGRRALRLGLAVDGRLDPGRLATVAVALHRGEGELLGVGERAAGERELLELARARCRRRPRPGTPRPRRSSVISCAVRLERLVELGASWSSPSSPAPAGCAARPWRPPVGIWMRSADGAGGVALVGHAEGQLPEAARRRRPRRRR